MTLTEWQQRFDAWVAQHYTQADAAHDVAHFRRVWRTAQSLMAGQEVDGLVILTACYFHDIVSLAKNDPQRSLASRMAAEKTTAILREDFPLSRKSATLRYATLLRRTAIAPGLCHKRRKRKLSRMPTGLKPWGRLGWRAFLR
jgi:uncharacterized protein